MLAAAGYVVMSGNLFDSAVMKISVIDQEFRRRFLSNPDRPNVFKGKAIVFEGPEDYHHRIEDPDLGVEEQSVLIIRNCGPVPATAELAQQFLDTGTLPPAAKVDAVHLAVATLAAADYLLTWNCRHLANAQILRRLEREASKHGWVLPKVCTPLELMGDWAYETEIEPDS